MARHLITSALPYINGIKHLGNLVGSQLPADLYARFLRARGHEVMFICATDEHGTPAELAALGAFAKERRLGLHMDGARFANAVASADNYADRLRSDPLLSQLLHQILSGITAVRSSAEILEDVPDLDALGRHQRPLAVW